MIYLSRQFYYQEAASVTAGMNDVDESFLTYHVCGVLIDASSQQTMEGYLAIAETGIRDESSPFELWGISGPHEPGERITDDRGRFVATFITTGMKDLPIDCVPLPPMIEIHIQFRPGTWRCREVPVLSKTQTAIADHEYEIDLGEIVVDYDLCRKPTNK
ncbi:MAG: hypothetical protein P8M30_02465 [Planctomycetaceae bacterium]|nr:hypothetical protein [Planctomycetaceae bacterium]MDB4786674.1 hypothetical protein [Planctomycetaceae bacterium]MDC0308105.1 hypothetical protein [Planctomycetaceae bacterium]MDG2388160.1 hypothetical protein [Planctomycetaceae bacterium]